MCIVDAWRHMEKKLMMSGGQRLPYKTGHCWKRTLSLPLENITIHVDSFAFREIGFKIILDNSFIFASCAAKYHKRAICQQDNSVGRMLD